MTNTISHSGRVQTGPRRWRHSARGAVLLAGLLLSATSVFAQPAQPPPPPPSGPVVTVSRSWYLEAAIVAGMCGLALFVVCRSSRRN
jgi:hypothetical protein